MIEFLQDYETDALPPEVFKSGQRVTRSKASETYLVGLGVAAYVVNGKLVDQDHRPVEVRSTVVEVVTPGERRGVSSARGGEVIGLDAPQRASTGPVAGTPEVVLRAQVEQLTTERDAATDALTSQQDGHEAEIASIRAERDQARADLGAASKARDDAISDATAKSAALAEAQAALEAANARVAQLEAVATPPAADGDTAKSGKPK